MLFIKSSLQSKNAPITEFSYKSLTDINGTDRGTQTTRGKKFIQRSHSETRIQRTALFITKPNFYSLKQAAKPKPFTQRQVEALLTFTDTSITKTRKHSSSMLSVRPHGGSQAGRRYRTSDVTVSEDGVSMKANARIMVMVKLKILLG